MSEPREVEVWPCGYVAKCAVPWCRQRATTILRYLDKQGRPYRQVDVCKNHARELCAGMKVIDRTGGAPEMPDKTVKRRLHEEGVTLWVDLRMETVRDDVREGAPRVADNR